MSKFENVLVALRKLHHICNKEYLCLNYTKVIDDFTKAWYKLANKYDNYMTKKYILYWTT